MAKRMKKLGPRLKVTDQLREQVRAERAAGVHIKDIAERFGMAKSTVDRILRGGPRISDVARSIREIRLPPANVADNDPALKEIRAGIATLQQRAANRLRELSGRTNLLAYVKKLNLTRSDLKWVHDQLPLVRISVKHRMAKAAEGKE